MDPKPYDQKLASVDARVDALEAELRVKELEIALLDRQRSDLERRIREIHASTSWRVTWPVRAVSTALRKLAAGVRRKTAVRFQRLPALAGTIAHELPATIPGEDTFVLYRIVGNDLHPRHRIGQSLDNLTFIVDHEPEFPGCEKAFVLNRIVDEKQEELAARLLEKRGYRYFRIPFDPDEYRKTELDEDVLSWRDERAGKMGGALDQAAALRLRMALYRHKNHYVMNVNQARNAALADGRGRARWVLPWDGNCFLTAEAWQHILADILRQEEKKYFLVPMARMLSNAPLVSGGGVPRPVDEPQIIFRADAVELFNPAVYYGHRDKVELLWRLGAKGEWSSYHDDPWDPPRAAVSSDVAHVGWAGWVARLFSGKGALEEDSGHAALHRGMARSIAVVEFLRRLDADFGCRESAGDSTDSCFQNGQMKGRI